VQVWIKKSRSGNAKLLKCIYKAKAYLHLQAASKQRALCMGAPYYMGPCAKQIIMVGEPYVCNAGSK
jgi:hypothetical protein